MSATANQPSTKSFLSPLGFKFVIKKTPHINYFVQAVSLPSISLNRSEIPTPFVKLPYAGDHVDFSDLTVTFKVDEDLKNYLEIYNWITSIGFPDSFDQYKTIDEIRRSKNTGNVPAMSGQGVYSDATLTILSSAMNPIHNITFINAFPTSVSELEFTTTDSDVNYLTSTVTFAYQKYNIESL